MRCDVYLSESGLLHDYLQFHPFSCKAEDDFLCNCHIFFSHSLMLTGRLRVSVTWLL